MRATSFWSLGLLLLACACGSTRKDTQASSQSSTTTQPVLVHKPWTEKFQTPTLVIADELRIEGPDGLLDHLATRMHAEAHVKRERVTEEGFLQEFSLASGVAPLELRAYLDRYELVAMKRLHVLERPGPVDVVIVAHGDVFVRDAASQAVQRAPTLRIEGKIER